MSRWSVACLYTLALCSCSTVSFFSKPCNQDPACIRILFIGNSYTYVNDLPGTLAKLAASSGMRIETGLAATGGWTLDDHLQSADSLAQINGAKWSYVVLQEQSEIPASPEARVAQMYPAAQMLAGKIKSVGAKTILFITWAHRDGMPGTNMHTYSDMQVSINKGYFTLGQQLSAIIAPVGYVWLKVRQQNPQISLWQDDGSHPSEAGTYLAACVFYSVLFHKSPEGLSYQGSLSNFEAEALQRAAAETVLEQRNPWNLP